MKQKNTLFTRRPSRRTALLAFAAFTFVACIAGASDVRADQPRPTVYVILWFDTEDYLLPASDDAALRLADYLTHEGIRATFKVVGEKARTLERRGRSDVIRALAKHEIGYHSNYHSTQPSPAMYLNEMGWDEGVREFGRREKPGFDDVRRILGQQPSCYGQPGSSWGPQTYGTLERWGVRVYLDAGRHVGLDDKPFYYGNALTFFKLAHFQRTGLRGPEDAAQAEARFAASRDALLKEGGGVVSVMYHPCEFVHKEFWDKVNFANGANPPREAWKLPGEKTAEEKAAAFATFERYIRFMKRFSDVEFITASQALVLYRDSSREHTFSKSELTAIAQAVKPEVTFQRHGNMTLSPAEIFSLLNAFVASSQRQKPDDSLVSRPAPRPFGPTAAERKSIAPVEVPSDQFLRTACDVQDGLATEGRIPDVIWLGSVAVGPEVYLQGLASMAGCLLDAKPIPDIVSLPPATLASAQYVSADDPKLWNWIIFPKGFHAPALMQLARRQAWTLKPAILQDLKH